MRIRVDVDRCEGHGRCYSLVPELFDSDDTGRGHEIGDGEVSTEQEERARTAVLNCPERAVVLEQ